MKTRSARAFSVHSDAFPGFRGVPGASSALVALVEQIGRARRSTA
jgi:hypothetical protein